MQNPPCLSGLLEYKSTAWCIAAIRAESAQDPSLTVTSKDWRPKSALRKPPTFCLCCTSFCPPVFSAHPALYSRNVFVEHAVTAWRGMVLWWTQQHATLFTLPQSLSRIHAHIQLKYTYMHVYICRYIINNTYTLQINQIANDL